MKKMLFLCVVVMLTGCDDGISGPVSDYPHGIDQSVDVTAAAEEPGEPRMIGGDGPSQPLRVTLGNLNSQGSADGLTIQVESISRYAFSVSARLVCRGLISHSAALELGNAELTPGDMWTLNVKAQDIPVQSTTGVNEARIELMLKAGSGDGKSVRLMSPPPFYYQHDSSWSRVRVFDERLLMDEYNGRLSGGPMTEKNAGELLGRIVENGIVKEVKAMDEEFAVRSNGRLAGWITGMDISVETEDGKEVSR